ncbi:TPA: hypothetical protein H1008_00270 [archaeon]|nr:hypothetical protein [Candidatus Undinarchaeales archaeon SRR5007147.bin71]
MNITARGSAYFILLAFFLLSAGMLASESELTAKLTGKVVGAPDCISTLKMTPGHAEIVLAPGSSAETTLTISDVQCGASYIRLDVEDLPSEYFEFAPSYLRTLTPGDTGRFIIYLDIPLDAEYKAYTATYKLYTSEGRYAGPELTLSIEDVEKPQLRARTESITEGSPSEKESMDNSQFWWLIMLGAVVFVAAIYASEYFEKKLHENEEKRKRPSHGKTTLRSLVKKDRKKEELNIKRVSKALKKGKKR